MKAEDLTELLESGEMTTDEICPVFYESPSQLYQDRIILITDMVGKGCLLYTKNTKLLFFGSFAFIL